MLTAKEQQTLDFISHYVAEQGYAPTIAEIADGIGIRSRGVVHRYIKALEEAGCLELLAGKHRNIRLAPATETPWILPIAGRIAAGEPIEAVAEQESFDLTEKFGKASWFLLQVKGESMINEGIHEGDYVVCEPRDQARNGEIVVALIDGEAATLKRFYNNDDGTITLVPANQMFSPIRYDAKRVAIQGIYKGLFRLER